MFMMQVLVRESLKEKTGTFPLEMNKKRMIHSKRKKDHTNACVESRAAGG